MSLPGTKRTSRGGPTMSGYRGRPEVAEPRSKRREWPSADKVMRSICSSR